MADDNEVLSYEKFCDMQWNEDGWWDWLLEDASERALEVGLDIGADAFTFDLYHHSCGSTGRIVHRGKFVDTYYERLMNVSPVLTQMLKEDFLRFKWDTDRNGRIRVQDYDDYGWWDERDEFAEGIFAGTSVESLFEAETEHEKFESELLAIIYEWHQDEVFKVLQAEDDWRTSRECYEEWVKEWTAEQEWEQTKKLKPLQICGVFP